MPLSYCVNVTGLQCGVEVVSSEPLAVTALVLIPVLGLILSGLLTGSINKMKFWLLWLSLIIFEGAGLFVYFMLVAR